MLADSWVSWVYFRGFSVWTFANWYSLHTGDAEIGEQRAGRTYCRVKVASFSNCDLFSWCLKAHGVTFLIPVQTFLFHNCFMSRYVVCSVLCGIPHSKPGVQYALVRVNILSVELAFSVLCVQFLTAGVTRPSSTVKLWSLSQDGTQIAAKELYLVAPPGRLYNTFVRILS